MYNNTQEKVTLDAALMCNMRIGMVFKDFSNPIRGFDFSRDGLNLAVYDEEKLITYDLVNAKPFKTLFNKVNKINRLVFTHHNSAVLFSPQEGPYDLFYWSIFDNEIIKQFKGSHEYKATNLVLNPIRDLALVTYEDNSLKLYDIHKLENQPIQ